MLANLLTNKALFHLYDEEIPINCIAKRFFIWYSNYILPMLAYFLGSLLLSIDDIISDRIKLDKMSDKEKLLL